MKKTYGDQEALVLIDQNHEHKARLLFDLCPQPIAFVSKEGKFLRVNQALCKLLHYSNVELCDKNFTEITHPEDIGIDWANLKKVERGECDTYTMVKRFITKTGQIVKITLTVYPVRDVHKNIVIYVSHVVPVEDKSSVTEHQNPRRKIKSIKEKIFDLLIANWHQIIMAIIALGMGIIFLVDLRQKIIESNELTVKSIESINKLNSCIEKSMAENYK